MGVYGLPIDFRHWWWTISFMVLIVPIEGRDLVFLTSAMFTASLGQTSSIGYCPELNIFPA